jgi:hypothetical protein
MNPRPKRTQMAVPKIDIRDSQTRKEVKDLSERLGKIEGAFKELEELRAMHGLEDPRMPEMQDQEAIQVQSQPFDARLEDFMPAVPEEAFYHYLWQCAQHVDKYHPYKFNDFLRYLKSVGMKSYRIPAGPYFVYVNGPMPFNPAMGYSRFTVHVSTEAKTYNAAFNVSDMVLMKAGSDGEVASIVETLLRGSLGLIKDFAIKEREEDPDSGSLIRELNRMMLTSDLTNLSRYEFIPELKHLPTATPTIEEEQMSIKYRCLGAARIPKYGSQPKPVSLVMVEAANFRVEVAVDPKGDINKEMKQAVSNLNQELWRAGRLPESQQLTWSDLPDSDAFIDAVKGMRPSISSIREDAVTPIIAATAMPQTSTTTQENTRMSTKDFVKGSVKDAAMAAGAVKAQKALVALVKSVVASKYPEFEFIADSPAGKVVIDLATPLVVRAAAEYMVNPEDPKVYGKISELAEFAFRGQTMKYALEYADQVEDLVVAFKNSSELKRVIELAEDPKMTTIMEAAREKEKAKA